MRGSVRIASATALAMTGSLALAGVTLAEDSPPANLGNGLGALVKPQAAVSKYRSAQDRLAIRDKAGRVLVDVYARPDSSVTAVRQTSQARGVNVVAQSAEQKVVEGFVAVSNVKALATSAGVASVSMALKPFTNVGAATSQGVHASRADRVGGLDGRGITVGALSDSFDTSADTDIHAADDIKTGDLPKDGVTVVQDDQAGEDEGRAMLQLVHDIAPRAKECFATAFAGEVQFADNIRALADKSGPCKADVITDDVGYFDEPFFGDGIISDAVDDVAAQGVHYFSSAANGSSQQAYQAPLRIVPTDRPGDVSNINLDGVDPALYAGGFQDFDPGSRVDIAQNLYLGGDGSGAGIALMDLQWDDPLDPNGSTFSDPLFSKNGEITTAAPVASFPFDGKAGETIRGFVDAIPSGETDFILTLKDPGGNVLQSVDTVTSPETLFQTLPADGRYTFEISGFNGDLGDFTFDIRDVLSKSRTTTDLNALFFDQDGNFVFSQSDLNQFSGRPMEIPAFLGPTGPLQVVIAKANTDPGQATQLRYQLEDDLQYTEYDQPFAPSIFGHPAARGASAVAAYDPFRPLMPEDFTSVGGELPILFDSNGDRLPKPDIRRKPDVAATDGGNTTFFVSDSLLDPDNQPNFFGTSAAAPHAAGIAALVLQAHGGRGSLSPTAMRTILQRNAFAHDLDPFHAADSSRGLTITADGQLGREHLQSVPLDENPGSLNNPQFFKVAYSGPGSIVSLTFDGAEANPTGLARRGNGSDGLVFDPRPFTGLPGIGGDELWQQGFPFTVGAASDGIDPATVTASFARPGVGLASSQQFQRMTVHFPSGALGGGRSVSFGIDRDEATTAFGVAEDGNSADQLGAQELFPEGVVAQGGLTYRAVTSTGRVLTGRLRNRVGAGWTPVDGFGYINAEAAVGRRSHR